MFRSLLSHMLMPRLRLRLMSMRRSQLRLTLMFRFPLNLTSMLSQLLLQSLLLPQLLMPDMPQLPTMLLPRHTPVMDMVMPQLLTQHLLPPQSPPLPKLPYKYKLTMLTLATRLHSEKIPETTVQHYCDQQGFHRQFS